MKKVALVVGHSSTEQGAYNENFKITEYQFNSKFAAIFSKSLHKKGFTPVVLYRNSLEQLVNDVNQTKADLAIELHCNSAENKEANGTEVLYWHSSKKGELIAAYLQIGLINGLNERDRGTKAIEPGERGAYFLQKTTMTSCILEPFFLSNDDSLKNALAMRKNLADSLAESIYLYYQKEVNKAH